jgi:hypothetical protein
MRKIVSMFVTALSTLRQLRYVNNVIHNKHRKISIAITSIP